jgi:squalene-hopene/tetraprenyl-beta-curcumene cyclase
VLGLLAGGDAASESLRRGAGYLAAAQREDGTWDEPSATGAGLPGVCLRRDLGRNSLPVLALAAYRNTRGMRQGDNQ